MGDGIIFKRAEHYQSPKNRWNLHIQFDISELLVISLIFLLNESLALLVCKMQY